MTTSISTSSNNNNNLNPVKRVETPTYDLVSKVAPMITEAEYAKIQAEASTQPLPQKTKFIRKIATGCAYSFSVTPKGVVYIHLGKRGKLVGKGTSKKVYECVRLKNGSVSKRAEVRIKNGTVADAIREDKLAKKFHSRHIVKASNTSVTYLSLNHYKRSIRFMQPLMAKDALTFYYENPSFEQKLKLLEDTARGLKAMHDKGYLHRDVKPENIFLNDKGHTKLADLGFAVLHTEDNNTAGTPNYLPYKISRSGQIVITEKQTFKTDLYSLGVTIEGITGSHATEDIMQLSADLQDPVPANRPTLTHVISTLRKTRKEAQASGITVTKAAK